LAVDWLDSRVLIRSLEQVQANPGLGKRRGTPRHEADVEASVPASAFAAGRVAAPSSCAWADHPGWSGASEAGSRVAAGVASYV